MEMNQAPRRRSYEKPPRAHTGFTVVLRAAVCAAVYLVRFSRIKSYHKAVAIYIKLF
jgi:hypothetical protein